MQYSLELREAVLRRILSPNNESIALVARQEGISEQTIRNWKKQALSGEYHPIKEVKPERWSSQDKFYIVVETMGMNETEIAEYARLKGVFVEEIEQWREACLNANAGLAKMLSSTNKKLRESERDIKKLQREITLKDKALAETAALLVLRKKMNAIWGEKKDA